MGLEQPQDALLIRFSQHCHVIRCQALPAQQQLSDCTVMLLQTAKKQKQKSASLCGYKNGHVNLQCEGLTWWCCASHNTFLCMSKNELFTEQWNHHGIIQMENDLVSKWIQKRISISPLLTYGDQYVSKREMCTYRFVSKG